MLNLSVNYKKIEKNPILKAKLLKVENVRERIISKQLTEEEKTMLLSRDITLYVPRLRKIVGLDDLDPTATGVLWKGRKEWGRHKVYMMQMKPREDRIDGALMGRAKKAFGGARARARAG